MHDVNPLGPLMHLKELERQAAPRLHPLRAKRQDVSNLTPVSSLMIAFLQRLHSVRFLWRVVGRLANT